MRCLMRPKPPPERGSPPTRRRSASSRSSSEVAFRAGAIVATGLLTCLLAAGCGGSSSSSDAPAAAAKQFVTAVTHDDRATWCGQIGQALMVAHRTGGLAPRLLSLCKTSDVFEITASCDREAVCSVPTASGTSPRSAAGRPTRSNRDGAQAPAALSASTETRSRRRTSRGSACAGASSSASARRRRAASRRAGSRSA